MAYCPEMSRIMLSPIIKLESHGGRGGRGRGDLPQDREEDMEMKR